MANKNLNAAKSAKKDEFYTQMEDIAGELKHYKAHFQGKTVLCNCDDPYESNFFKYFALNFNALGLKKLIATCYDGSPVQGNELLLDFGDGSEEKKVAYKVEITEVSDLNGDGRVDLADVRYLLQNDRNVLTTLKQHGDFRSAECIELLKEADIVCTNPPFSLFREYVAQLIHFDKKFLIIGNINAVKYKEISPLIIENKLWLGVSTNGSNRWFQVPDYYEAKENAAGYKVINNKKFLFVNGIMWYTNLDHKKRHEKMILYKSYSAEEFPKYDSFDAIDVSKVVQIPYDYYGIMGVPITFLNKYNPEQFEIIGILNHGCDNKYDLSKPIVNEKELFPRFLIRHKQ